MNRILFTLLFSLVFLLAACSVPAGDSTTPPTVPPETTEPPVIDLTRYTDEYSMVLLEACHDNRPGGYRAEVSFDQADYIISMDDFEPGYYGAPVTELLKASRSLEFEAPPTALVETHGAMVGAFGLSMDQESPVWLFPHFQNDWVNILFLDSDLQLEATIPAMYEDQEVMVEIDVELPQGWGVIHLDRSDPETIVITNNNVDFADLDWTDGSNGDISGAKIIDNDGLWFDFTYVEGTEYTGVSVDFYGVVRKAPTRFDVNLTDFEHVIPLKEMVLDCDLAPAINLFKHDLPSFSGIPAGLDLEKLDQSVEGVEATVVTVVRPVPDEDYFESFIPVANTSAIDLPTANEFDLEAGVLLYATGDGHIEYKDTLLESNSGVQVSWEIDVDISISEGWNAFAMTRDIVDLGGSRHAASVNIYEFSVNSLDWRLYSEVYLPPR